MEGVLIRGRYKVTRVLYAEQDYALLEAVDIQERENPSCLMNLYEGEAALRYGRLCSGLTAEDCSAFQQIFLDEGTLFLCLQLEKGQPIDQLFYRGDEWTWQERIDWTEKVLHRLMTLSNLPPELSCAAAHSENLLMDTSLEQVGLRWMFFPLEGVTKRDLAVLACDQALKTLSWTLDAPDAEWSFRRRMRRGAFHSMAELYSAWRQVKEEIAEGHKSFETASFVKKVILQAKRRFKRGRKEER